MNRPPRSPSTESVRSNHSHGSASPKEDRRGSISSVFKGDTGLPPISTIPSIPPWETSPQSPSTEKQRPFKSKSKHNLAVFGAKLSSTAASVSAHASKYKKDKDALKESNRESLFIDVPDALQHPLDVSSVSMNSPTTSSSSTSSTSGMLKSKMFKQSKNDLKSLRIKTDLGLSGARSSLSERSPMVRGGSTKELDRIAAIGQKGSPLQINDIAHGGALQPHHHHHHLHHPHINFRKRDSPAAVLSSSASNSTLASEGTVYSFNQSDSNGPSSAVTSLHSFKTVEEGATFLTRSWQILTSLIQTLYTQDEKLRVPVEDINAVVMMHFSTHYALGGTGLEILTRLDELLVSSLKSSSIIPKAANLEGLAESWSYFYTKILVALEAIFLPLQLEFDAMGQVLTSPQAARSYWYPITGSRPQSLHRNSISGRGKPPKLNIRQRILGSFRDVVVVPLLPVLKQQCEDLGNPASPSYLTETAMPVLQCFSTLSQLRSDGNNLQQNMQEYLKLVQGHMRRPRASSSDHRVSSRRVPEKV